MKRALLALFHVIVAITCFDVIAWTGDYYWRKIGERNMKDAKAAKEKEDWSKYRLSRWAKSVDSYIRANRSTPKHLAEIKGAKCSTFDVWGHEMRIEKEDGALYVVSAGADGEFGTKDDLKRKVGRNDD